MRNGLKFCQTLIVYSFCVFLSFFCYCLDFRKLILCLLDYKEMDQNTVISMKMQHLRISTDHKIESTKSLMTPLLAVQSFQP